jgi:hypothetical protein
MHVIYALVRLYPWWALPLILILGELGWYFHRKAARPQYYCWGLAGLLLILTVLWFAYRGDLYSDRWVKSLVGG